MPQNGDTLTSLPTPRNLRARAGSLFLMFFMLCLVAPRQISLAQQDPFNEPLKSLNKIDPSNVVQFKLVKTTTNGNAGSAELELDTRGGFKIYDHGLRFEYKSPATLDTPVPLKMQAQPPAKVIQDPFYNEPRAIHDKGSRFLLNSDVPIDETGFIRVRFEACSVNTCLLPAHFLIPARVGQTSRAEPKSDGLAAGGGLGPTASSRKSDNSGSNDFLKAAPVSPSTGGSAADPVKSVESAPSKSPTPEITPTVLATPTMAQLSTPPPQEVSLTDSITSEVQRNLLSAGFCFLHSFLPDC